MKQIITVILVTLFSIKVFGQKTEFSIHATSGLFSFHGASSGSTTFYLLRDRLNLPGYTNNPYGNKSGFSYGFSLNVQRVTKANFIYGIESGYESLKSRIKIQSILADDSNLAVSSDSKTELSNHFLNFHPFVGKRLNLIKNIQSDLILGIDIGIFLKTQEQPNISTSEKTYFSNYERSKPENNDYRLRLDMVNYYKRIGITIGYSYGITNYLSGRVGGDPIAFSKMIRLGLVYKI